MRTLEQKKKKQIDFIPSNNEWEFLPTFTSTYRPLYISSLFHFNRMLRTLKIMFKKLHSILLKLINIQLRLLLLRLKIFEMEDFLLFLLFFTPVNGEAVLLIKLIFNGGVFCLNTYQDLASSYSAACPLPLPWRKRKNKFQLNASEPTRCITIYFF